jgi:hypothetical protein
MLMYCEEQEKVLARFDVGDACRPDGSNIIGPWSTPDIDPVCAPGRSVEQL